jgi:hypothetical protein
LLKSHAPAVLNPLAGQMRHCYPPGFKFETLSLDVPCTIFPETTQMRRTISFAAWQSADIIRNNSTEHAIRRAPR